MIYIDIFKESVLKNSNKIAVVDHNSTRKTTYAELWAMANKAAFMIDSMKTRSHEPFLIRMDRTAEYIATYLGILMAGCVSVPVTPSYPDDRLQAVMKDCKANHILTDSYLDDAPKGVEYKCVESKGTDMALLLYTSGSTGTPKGVVHDHDSIVAATERNCELVEGLDLLNYGSFPPFNFAPATSEIFGVLRSGGTVYVIDDDVRKDPIKLIEFYCKNNITFTFIPPQLMKIVLDVAKDKPLPFKRVVCGAERVVNIYTDKFEIYNVYGMSETIAGISYFKLDKAYSFTPVGKPYKNVTITLKDGEICAKSHYARLYLNLEKQSKERFELCDDGEVIVHTGDNGKIDENGNLIVTGRLDFMCKINGQRVEPEETESRLLGVPGIKEACVMGVRTDYDRTALAAFYRSDEFLTPEYIQRELAKSLPSYMIPTIFRRIVKMPRNLNGKIDRSKLLGAWEFQSRERAEVVPPVSDEEKKMVSIYSNILDLNGNEIGIKNNFFTIGGDSLRAVLLCIEINKAFGVQIAPADIFKYPTIEEQIELIHKNDRVGDIYKCSDNPDLPDLFFVHTAHSGGEAYFDLSRLLKNVCNMKCFEPHNVFHPDDVITGIENLAAKYITTLKNEKPEGPYILGGWSYGGLLAYEMACQLVAGGDKVDYLFLLDPNFMSGDRERALHIQMFTNDNFDSYLKLDPLFERFRQMGLIDQVAINSKNVVYDIADYVPKPYDGKATLIKACCYDDDEITGTDLMEIIKNKKANGFDSLISDLMVIDIDSNHDGLLSGDSLYEVACHIEYTLKSMRDGEING